jgi:small subunit ribosomal protein S17
MADEEKNEKTEVDAVAETEEVSDTVPAPEAEAEAPATEAGSAPEPVAETEDVSDTEVSDTVPAPEAEAEAPVAEPEPEPEPAAPAKKQRSLKHVPRSARRTRTKLVRDKPATRKPITRTGKPESELGRRQERRGVVISDKGDKTIVVKVDVIKSHPKYKKVVRSTVKFHAHDEANTAGVGDTVRIIETRPLSKQKRWRLAEIVEKAK